MPLEPPRSRIASVALCAATAALAATVAQAQSDLVARPSALAPAGPAREALEEFPASAPTAPAPLLRGAMGDDDPPISAAAAFGAPRTRLPKPYPPPRAPYPPVFSPKNPLPPLEPYRTSYVARQGLRRDMRLRPTAAPPHAAADGRRDARAKAPAQT